MKSLIPVRIVGKDFSEEIGRSIMKWENIQIKEKIRSYISGISASTVTKRLEEKVTSSGMKILKYILIDTLKVFIWTFAHYRAKAIENMYKLKKSLVLVNFVLLLLA